VSAYKVRLRERLQEALGDAYTIERELGGAGMSRVFLATETTLGRRVVVKALPPEMSGSLVAGRFRREVQLIAQLRHPHVVPLLAAGESGRLLYYTMPYVAGESLRARLDRDGALPTPEAVRVLREIADALAYAHGRGVVHRDLKPDNILLADGHVLIVDFGIAKALQASADAEPGSDGAVRPFTSAGIALGTPAYMSPEQAAADPQVDHRADLYALGVLAYEMLAGQHPFTPRPPQAMLAAHVAEIPAPLSRRRAGLPRALAALVMRCLEKRPTDRPQTAAEVARALDALGLTPPGGGVVVAPPAPPAPATAPAATGGTRTWLVVVLCAATLVLGLGLGLWLGRR
jgi:serine/threonine-protein kinase